MKITVLIFLHLQTLLLAVAVAVVLADKDVYKPPARTYGPPSQEKQEAKVSGKKIMHFQVFYEHHVKYVF